MPVNWMDVSSVSFNALLLLERVQLSWLPEWVPERELAIALQANPAVVWYLRHQCPALNPWLDGVLASKDFALTLDEDQVREAEAAVSNKACPILTWISAPSPIG